MEKGGGGRGGFGDTFLIMVVGKEKERGVKMQPKTSALLAEYCVHTFLPKSYFGGYFCFPKRPFLQYKEQHQK